MNFVCIVFELGDKMLTLSSMENLIVQCNLQTVSCLLARILRMRLGILVLPKSTSSRFRLYLTWLTFRYRGVTVTRTFHNTLYNQLYLNAKIL